MTPIMQFTLGNDDHHDSDTEHDHHHKGLSYYNHSHHDHHHHPYELRHNDHHHHHHHHHHHGYDPHVSYPLFCEMDMLGMDHHGALKWKESARWVKFEENVEEGGNRWSKPYVASLSYVAVRKLKEAVSNGIVLLDVNVKTSQELAALIVEELRKKKGMSEDELNAIKEIIVRQHKHKLERKPSLANFRKGRRGSLQGSQSKKSFSEGQMPRGDTTTSLTESDHSEITPSKPRFHAPGSPKSPRLHHKSRNQSFMKKLPPQALAANILVGALEHITETVTVFVRLQEPHVLGEFTEVSLPTKFVVFHLTPGENSQKNKDIGRSVGAMLADGKFRGIAYNAASEKDIVEGIDSFMDDSIILPPGEWDPKIRIEPPARVPDRSPPPPPEVSEKEPLLDQDEEEEDEHGEDPTLARTGRLFGGLINDIKRKLPWYFSDLKDALHIQCFASICFIYIAALTPIITFGGLLGKATDNYMAAMEGIMAGAFCGITYALFAGQPLTIVGSTGPMLVFESILFNFCKDQDWDFMSFRIWVGIWSTFLLLLMVMFDLSFLVRYITRFTEEGFASLISLIFIYSAVEKILHMEDTYGVNQNPRDDVHRTCHCYLPPPTPAPTVDYNTTANVTSVYDIATTTMSSLASNMSNFTEPVSKWQYNTTFKIDYWERKQCYKKGGDLIGPGCDYVPDVFLFSVLIFMGTFVISYTLKMFKTSPFFPSKVREIVSDFAVVIAVILMTLTDLMTGLDTPKLEVPEKFQPTRGDRPWFINPFSPKNPWFLILLAAIPAALVTILIFLDQQITAVIVNRKENKMKKGAGYHLDLFVIAIQITACCFFGLPWFVAATVRAMTHVNSLRKESEAAAPGEKPEHLGTREQRVTPFFVSLLIGLSVQLTVVFKRIPMPVLYGVFMYMGISSLKGLQFVDRLLILFMPQKYQPDHHYLRTVRTWRVHIFTLIQIVCMIGMWVFKSTKSISIAFPLMVLAMCFVRKAMEKIFTQRELRELDNVLPGTSINKKRAKEAEMNKEMQTINNDSDLRQRHTKANSDMV